MTLEELEDSLPNGLHDAEIKDLLIDYPRGEVRMELRVWVGDIERREAYRDGTLVLEGLQFVAIEPPDPRYAFAKDTRLRIDVTHDKKHLRAPAIDKVPKDCFVSGLFVQEWNAYVYVAARHASLAWKGDVYDRDTPRAWPRP